MIEIKITADSLKDVYPELREAAKMVSVYEDADPRQWVADEWMEANPKGTTRVKPQSDPTTYSGYICEWCGIGIKEEAVFRGWRSEKPTYCPSCGRLINWGDEEDEL